LNRVWTHNPLVRAVLWASAAWYALVMVAPEWLLGVTAGEGPTEHVEHAVLLLAVLTWASVGGGLAQRRRVIPGIAALMMVLQLALLLMEETDFGAVYNAPGLADPFQVILNGNRNLRQALHALAPAMKSALDASLLSWLVVFFGLPVLRLGSRLEPAVATAPEAAAAATLAVTLLLAATLCWYHFMPTWFQLQLYALVLVAGVRANRDLLRA